MELLNKEKFDSYMEKYALERDINWDQKDYIKIKNRYDILCESYKKVISFEYFINRVIYNNVD